jgi:hypothetical protein
MGRRVGRVVSRPGYGGCLAIHRHHVGDEHPIGANAGLFETAGRDDSSILGVRDSQLSGAVSRDCGGGGAICGILLFHGGVEIPAAGSGDAPRCWDIPDVGARDDAVCDHCICGRHCSRSTTAAKSKTPPPLRRAQFLASAELLVSLSAVHPKKLLSQIANLPYNMCRIDEQAQHLVAAPQPASQP